MFFYWKCAKTYELTIIEDACGGPSPHPINVCMLCASCFEHQAAEAGAETEAEAEAMIILGKDKGTPVKICVRKFPDTGNVEKILQKGTQKGRKTGFCRNLRHHIKKEPECHPKSLGGCFILEVSFQQISEKVGSKKTPTFSESSKSVWCDFWCF